MSGSREFFFHFKGFSGTDIYHSDVKMRAGTAEKFFLIAKNYFLKFPKVFPTKCLIDRKFFV